jgi:hypothetical protein
MVFLKMVEKLGLQVQDLSWVIGEGMCSSLGVLLVYYSK